MDLLGWKTCQKLIIIIVIIIIIIIINNKRGQQCKAEIRPISLKTPASQYQPIDRKKINGKIVEHYSRDIAA